jgi:hypothetical protein
MRTGVIGDVASDLFHRNPAVSRFAKAVTILD